jgi:hypothetical protein
VTRDQGRQLTAIETFINLQLREDRIEGFEAFRTRSESTPAESQPAAPAPIFGRTMRRYSRRL